MIATPFHAATPPERMEAMRKAVRSAASARRRIASGRSSSSASAMSGYVTGQILHVNGGQLMP